MDNFAQVLEFNGAENITGVGDDYSWSNCFRINHKNIIKVAWNTNNEEIYIFLEDNDEEVSFSKSLFDWFLQCLELKIGKLKELPDFYYLPFALLNHLPTTLVNGEYFTFQRTIANENYKPTKQNAETVLEIKKLMDTLERA